MSEWSFDRVITEHLALAERNKRLERAMPLDHYRDKHEGGSVDDPPLRQEEPSTEVNAAALRRDPDSWWDTKGGGCPPPPLAWDGE
jgi:hypothetical protein